MTTFDQVLGKIGALTAAEEICKKHGVKSVEDLRLPNRHASVVRARAEFCAWVRKTWNWSYPEIGALVNRDHTSVMSLIKTHGENGANGSSPIDAVPSDGHPFTRPAEPHDKKPVDQNAPRCEACMRYHGSVNQEVNCMRDEIRRLRGVVKAMSEEKKKEPVSHVTNPVSTTQEEAKP